MLILCEWRTCLDEEITSFESYFHSSKKLLCAITCVSFRLRLGRAVGYNRWTNLSIKKTCSAPCADESSLLFTGAWEGIFRWQSSTNTQFSYHFTAKDNRRCAGLWLATARYKFTPEDLTNMRIKWDLEASRRGIANLWKIFFAAVKLCNYLVTVYSTSGTRVSCLLYDDGQ